MNEVYLLPFRTNKIYGRPRKRKDSAESSRLRLRLRQTKSAMGDLISDCTALGVKQARLYHRLLYGTGEVDTVLVTKKGNSHAGIA